MDNHTPTPWRVEGDTLNVIAGIDSKQVRVLTVDGSTEEFKIDRANAAFIVRAVNAHSPMVEIIKDSAELLRVIKTSMQGQNPTLDQELDYQIKAIEEIIR